MDQKLYQTGIRYAKSLIRHSNPVYSARDLVHDAYFKCKTKPEEWLLLWAIKMTHFNKLREKYITLDFKTGKNGYKGEDVPKRWIQINPTESDFEDGSIDLPSNDEFNIDERSFIDTLSDFDKQVLYLKDQGYVYAEIEKILETNNYALSKSYKRIKEMYTNSPFNGSKLKIVKRVKRKEFEENREKYLEEYGVEGDWDKNEHFEQFPSKKDNSIGILVKENTSD